MCEQREAGPELLRKPTINKDQEKRYCVSKHDLLLWEPELNKLAISYATGFINTANTQNDHFAAVSCAISSWTKLKKITAYVLPFIYRLKKRVAMGGIGKISLLSKNASNILLTFKELEQAQHLILQHH